MGGYSDTLQPERAFRQWRKGQRLRQAERPMQGPPTEIQMLRDEIKALRDRQADHEYAQSLPYRPHGF